MARDRSVHGSRPTAGGDVRRKSGWCIAVADRDRRDRKGVFCLLKDDGVRFEGGGALIIIAHGVFITDCR